MNFPHLQDTRFPNLSTVNVYQFQNQFDYTRWNEKTLIKLVNVIWNSDYTDVVKFETNQERDSWFDSLSDYWALELETAARVVPEGYVKLPVPYDVMARYNYLFIDMPIATSEDSPLDYENTQGVRRWYFFVNDIVYLSPNATQVFVTPDVWTNFQNDIEITYMMLERGHAPVAFSDTDSYLANPVANNKYLLAPDVNIDNAGITRSSDYVPFGNGTKWVCIASTCAPEQISTLGSVTTDSSYNPSGNISYSNTSDRFGYQLQVNGLSMGNGRDYSTARTPAKAGHSDDNRIPNNLSVYAIAATECYGNGTFFADVISQCPQFLNTVKACFVVDDACITRSTEYTIAGHKLYRCVGKSQTLLEKALKKTDFAYPSEYERFAKLYTSPYAQLEITDNDGTTFTVNIEETSTLQVKSVVSTAFPYINERVYVDGIGGTGSKSYKWVDLNGTENNLEMSNGDWFKYCFDWQIPTFALYMDGETAYQLESFNRNVKNAIRQALVNYHNNVRSANTAYENACDQADVAYTNTTANAATAKANADRSADTGKTNADNSANTAKTNTDNAADTAYNNNDRNCTTASANLTLSNTGTAYNEEYGISASTDITVHNNVKNASNLTATNSAMITTTDIEIQKTTATTTHSILGSIGMGALNGAANMAAIGATVGAAAGSFVPALGTALGAGGGAVGGAIIGALGGGISAAVSYTDLGTVTQASEASKDAQIALNNNLYNQGNTAANAIQAEQNELRRAVYRENATISVQQQDNINSTSRTNASATRSTTKTNASNTQSTEKTNASNTQATSKANASAVQTTTNACAARTRDNVKANSGHTQQVSVLNAKETLENARNTGMASILDSRNTHPIEVCPYSGNPSADYMRTRGVQVKVKTQSDSAIRQTGDTFVRYGYALNQLWNVQETGLTLMKHFTYWKAAEIWVDDRQSSNNAVQDFIQRIFLNGVTIWNSPTEVGRINVYDN